MGHDEKQPMNRPIIINNVFVESYRSLFSTLCADGNLSWVTANFENKIKLITKMTHCCFHCGPICVDLSSFFSFSFLTWRPASRWEEQETWTNWKEDERRKSSVWVWQPPAGYLQNHSDLLIEWPGNKTCVLQTGVFNLWGGGLLVQSGWIWVGWFPHIILCPKEYFYSGK